MSRAGKTGRAVTFGLKSYAGGAVKLRHRLPKLTTPMERKLRRDKNKLKKISQQRRRRKHGR